jgi:hypothetical protein
MSEPEQLALPGIGPDAAARRKVIAERLRELELDQMYPATEQEDE